jgi:dinuclear metal center YbgI/SA1388 family protein
MAMGKKLASIVDFWNQRLAVNEIPNDASNNGLQVEGKSQVEKIVFGVDSCQSLFEKAAEMGADLVCTHHGISWGDGMRRLVGSTARRLSTLFNHGVSLYAVHLPLDAHAELGHNALMAEAIGIWDKVSFAPYSGVNIGYCGHMPEPRQLRELADSLERKLLSDIADFLPEEEDVAGEAGVARIFGADDSAFVRNVGIISGGAGSSGIQAAARAGVDCLITGELNHSCYHEALENNLSVIELGHYLSETPGILAMAKATTSKFELECVFIDLPTGL